MTHIGRYSHHMTTARLALILYTCSFNCLVKQLTELILNRKCKGRHITAKARSYTTNMKYNYDKCFQEREKAVEHWRLQYSEGIATINQRLVTKTEELKAISALRAERQALVIL